MLVPESLVKTSIISIFKLYSPSSGYLAQPTEKYPNIFPKGLLQYFKFVFVMIVGITLHVHVFNLY